MKHRIKILLLAAIFTGTSLFAGLLQAPSTSALSGSQFKAGRIIDDSLFYNGETMTASQIQQFLDAKVPACDTNGDKIFSGTTTRAEYGASRGYPAPYTCLKSFKQNTPYRAGESGLCSAISAKSGRTAAQIIDDVARACHISQKALIVMLQKEQALITDDWPWTIQYRSAMGYGCPDGGAVCDSEYYGFFNQVYNAARQFQRYKADPNNWNHVPRMNNHILYQADMPSCGGTTVYIENYATAGLYNYTPYTPNKAALDNLYGGGDDCSAYGNRNFWRYYSDWFGSTEGSPFYKIDGQDTVYINGVNDTYYSVANLNDLTAYGWGTTVKRILSYSSSYTTNKTHLGKLPRIASFEGSTIYLIDRGLRHPFDSLTMLEAYGYSLGDHARLPAGTLNFYISSSKAMPIGVSDTGKKFFINNGKKRFIVNEAAYKSGSPSYSSLPGTGLSDDYLSTVPNLSPIWAPGSLLKPHSELSVYYIKDSHTKIKILNKQTLDDFGFTFKNVIGVKDEYINSYQNTVERLAPYARSIDGRTYMIGPNGSKHLISSDKTSSNYYKVNASTSPIIDSKLIDKLYTAKNATDLIRPITGKTVYLIKDGSLRKIDSTEELYRLGYTYDDVNDVSPLVFEHINNSL